MFHTPLCYVCERILYKKILQETEFMCGEEQPKAIDNIKEAISTAPLMRLPDSTKLFIINFAFVTNLGAALHQRDKHDNEYPVAFASRNQ